MATNGCWEGERQSLLRTGLFVGYQASVDGTILKNILRHKLYSIGFYMFIYIHIILIVLNWQGTIRIGADLISSNCMKITNIQ